MKLIANYKLLAFGFSGVNGVIAPLSATVKNLIYKKDSDRPAGFCANMFWRIKYQPSVSEFDRTTTDPRPGAPCTGQWTDWDKSCDLDSVDEDLCEPKLRLKSHDTGYHIEDCCTAECDDGNDVTTSCEKCYFASCKALQFTDDVSCITTENVALVSKIVRAPKENFTEIKTALINQSADAIRKMETS